MKLRVAALLTVLLSFAITTFSDEPKTSTSPTKKDDIRLLMEITGSKEISMQVITHMLASFKETMPDVPDAMWTMFLAEIDPDEMLELSIPAYDNHFTHEEIKSLINFYESPTGKKFIEKQPLVLQECMDAGQQWGQKLSETVTKKIKEYYGKEELPQKQHVGANAKTKPSNDYHNQLLSMISSASDEKLYKAYSSGKIDPTGSMCGLNFGMSMDEVIAIWGKPSGFDISSDKRISKQRLKYWASRLEFIDNKLYELSFHSRDFPDVEIWNNISFGISPDEFLTACSGLKSETRRKRTYYEVADGIVMRPHFYSNSDELITIELSSKHIKESGSSGLNRILGTYKIIACSTQKEDEDDMRIADDVLEKSNLIVTKDHITATYLLNQKSIILGNNPTTDPHTSNDRMVFGSLNGNKRFMYMQNSMIEVDSKVHKAKAFTFRMEDESRIRLWVK